MLSDHIPSRWICAKAQTNPGTIQRYWWWLIPISRWQCFGFQVHLKPVCDLETNTVSLYVFALFFFFDFGVFCLFVCLFCCCCCCCCCCFGVGGGGGVENVHNTLHNKCWPQIFNIFIFSEFAIYDIHCAKSKLCPCHMILAMFSISNGIRFNSNLFVGINIESKKYNYTDSKEYCRTSL